MTPSLDRQTPPLSNGLDLELTDQFADGSEIELALRTGDPAIRRIFTADLTRRLRSARRSLVDEVPFAFGAPGGTGRERRSTTTHPLPDGEVTVSIDASGTGSHAYLHTLVQGAVSYTRAVHVDVGRASLLALVLFGGGLALAALGPGVLSVPLFAAGVVVGLHVLVYRLSALGIVPAFSRIPEPGEPI